MKTTLRELIIGLLLIVISCRQTSNNENSITKANSDTNNFKKNTNDSFANLKKQKLDYIIFGRFCGECSGECATMYKLDILNNKLLTDHTDSYWNYKWGTPMKFETHIDDETKKILSKQILDSIPNSILTTHKPAERFGCPDCTDGCGIFFETKSDTTIKKFYLDYQTEQLTGDIKLFAEYLKKIIEKL
ncbi:MAG: hypothetical protein ACKO96_31910 [Flammeovirgaceae bacterium]